MSALEDDPNIEVLRELRDDAIEKSKAAYKRTRRYWRETEISLHKSIAISVAVGGLTMVSARRFSERKYLQAGIAAGLAGFGAKKVLKLRQAVLQNTLSASRSLSEYTNHREMSEALEEDIAVEELEILHSTQPVN